MRRMTCFVMALALVLGLAQCKKEQPVEPTSESNSLMITLDVKGDNNAKADVNPPQVTFENGDEIVVTCNGHYVGTLIKTTDEEGVSKFRGSITNATEGKPLYFYFFGNVTPQYFGENQYRCTVYIGDQTKELPVISMGPSINSKGEIVTYQDGTTSYTARLHNKCSLMKFNVTTPSTAPIFIDGMNNFVNVDFSDHSVNDGFSYSQKYDGVIKMKMKGQEGDTKTYWAIVLPQGPVEASDAYTADYSYIGTRPAIGRIGSNQYLSDGVDMTVNTSHNPLAIPLTFEAKTAGATVSLSKVGSPNSVSLEISINDGAWMPYNVNSPQSITLANEGDKVMFRGTNTKFATNPSNYHKFSIENGGCYVYGNIMSLIDATGFAGLDRFDTSEDGYHTFESLFYGCTGLYTHSIKTLKLPATTLTNYCYNLMFFGCANLTVAPVLPADVLKTGCYQGMFQKCTSLEESPVLWAEDLVSNCYASMFTNCTSLNRVTCLATSGISQGTNTSGWLSNVASTGLFLVAPNVEDWPESSESGIPDGWDWNEY